MRRTTSLKAVLCPLLSILVLVGLLMGFSAREYQLSAQTFQIEVDSVDVPQPVPTDTAPRQSLTITGKGFVSDSKVVLISPSKTRYPIPKDRYFFVSSSEILVYAGVGPGTWNAEVENPDGNKSDCEFTVQSVPNPGVAVDGHLLDRISTLIEEDDEGIYYRDTWQISKDQYKAWIATIAWGEGGLGGYAAHSQTPTSDVFYHIAPEVTCRFRFSTGIGPFQLDRGGKDSWDKWPTIRKLGGLEDPDEPLKSMLREQVRLYTGNETLEKFAARSPWFAVNPNYGGKPAELWNAVTGTSWTNHQTKRDGEDPLALNWNNIRDRLASNATTPAFDFESNVEKLSLGKVLWSIDEDIWDVENSLITTETNKAVKFVGALQTWLITARDSKNVEQFKYFYTYDDSLKIEVWVWDNRDDPINQFEYIFVRDYSDDKGDYSARAKPDYVKKEVVAGTSRYFAGIKTLVRPALVLEPSGEQPVTPTKPLDVILNIDRSGSMSGQKMTDAKSAAIMFAGLLNPQDRVGLVPFSTSATLDRSLTSDIGDVKTAIATYSAGGDTNMGDALDKAIKELKDKGKSDVILSIIYFTDGVTNTGPSKNEILNTFLPRAVEAGIIIYTLGYGGDVDEAFLRQVADKTGGKYYFAPDRAKLLEIYTELSQKIKGIGNVAELRGSVTVGDTKQETWLLKLKTLFIKLFLLWPGSDLDLTVIDPSGRRLVPGPNIIYSGSDALPEYYEIYDPQPGKWTIEVYGKEVTGDAEDYTIMIFQPEALMHVGPTSLDMNYPDDRRATITVREVAGMVDLESVEFTVSDLVGDEDTVISAGSVTFSPNQFTIRAGDTRDVQMTLRVPRGTTIGDYSGTVEVTSGDHNATLGLVVHVTSEDFPLLSGSWWAFIGMIVAVAVLFRLVVVFIIRREPVTVKLPHGSSCPKCGVPTLSGTRFCSSCDTELKPTSSQTTEWVEVICSECGYENIPGARFCQNCGKPLA